MGFALQSAQTAETPSGKSVTLGVMVHILNSGISFFNPAMSVFASAGNGAQPALLYGDPKLASPKSALSHLCPTAHCACVGK